MANQGAVSLDTVMLNIESNAGRATSNIDKLAVSLGNLKTALNGIRPSNLKNLATYIDNLKTSSDGLNKAMNKLSALNKLADLSKSLEGIQSPAGFKNLVDNIAKLPTLMGKIDTNTLENVGRISSELANKLNPLADAMQKVANGYTAISTLARNYNVSIKDVTSSVREQTKNNDDLSKSLKRVRNAFSYITTNIYKVFSIGTKTISGLSKPIKNIAKKISQMGFALLSVRSAFTFVRKAAGEYLALDTELQKSFTNTWRAMGAQLAPALEYVQYLFHQFVRVIYSVIYALTGIDLIARANEKAMKGWGKSAKDTLGNLQKFDDLNVVEFKNTSGGDNQLIDMDKIDLSPIQKVIDWMRKLKQEIQNAWNTGAWDGVTATLATGINDAFATIKPEILGAKISNAIKTSLSAIDTFITTLDWGAIGTAIGDTIRTMDWKGIWDGVVQILKDSLSGLDDFFDNLFGFKGGGELVGAYVIISKITKLVTSKDINNFFTNISKGFSGISRQITPLKTAFDLLKNNTLTTETISGITGVSDGVLKLMTPLADVATWFGTLATNVGALFGGSALAGGIAIIAGVVVAVLALVAAFKDLYKNNEQFRNSFDNLIKGIKTTGIAIFDTLKEAVIKVIGVLENIWKNVIVPLFNLLVEVVKPVLNAVIQILEILWNNVIAPLASFLMDVFSIAIDIVVGAFNVLIGVLKPVISILEWLWKNILSPIVDFLLDSVIWAIDKVTTGIKNDIDSLKDALNGIWNFTKKILNWILNGVESFINAIIKGLNLLIKKINTISFKAPDWVPKIGGKSIGFNLKLLDEVSIPRLETGTNEIPYEGIYHLHPGEAVVPKKYNPALGNGTNDETNQKLDTLIDIMNNMSFTNVVNVGNETLYKKQQQYNKMQQNKYGTINL